MYMGVHSLADVIGGLSIGVMCLVALEAVGWRADELSVQSSIGQLVATLLTVGSLGCVPDKRHTNTGYTELIDFAGLYIGACLVTGPTGRSLGAPPPTGLVAGASPGLLALQFVVGLLALGLFRTAIGVPAKLVVRTLPDGVAARAVRRRARKPSARRTSMRVERGRA